MKELKRIVKGLAILIGLASVMYAFMLMCVHMPYLLFVVFIVGLSWTCGKVLEDLK